MHGKDNEGAAAAMPDLSPEEYGSLLQETIGSVAEGQPSRVQRLVSSSSPAARIEKLQTLREKLGTD
ncbi:MAG TPA: hypothetical protein VFO29_01645 [Candidatus Rubrimentiphilum sp.]|nr:hypothetical protein [Candidatus Rubrimentiphilum sp.]